MNFFVPSWLRHVSRLKVTSHRDVDTLKLQRDDRVWLVTATLAMCVASAAILLAQTQPAARPPAQTGTAARPPMAEEVFTNVQILKGIPVNQFMETMGFFSASVGGDCGYCHTAEAGGN